MLNREDILIALSLGYKIEDIAVIYGCEKSDVLGYLPEGEDLARFRVSKEYRAEKLLKKAIEAIDELAEPSPGLLLKACDMIRSLAHDNLVKSDMLLNMKLKEKELNTNTLPEQIYIEGMEETNLERVMRVYGELRRSHK